MANPVVINVTNAKLLLGDTQASVTPPAGTGTAVQCQVTSAAVNVTPNLTDVPATFCAPASQSPAASGYELAISWLQDWTQGPVTGPPAIPAGGLSKWAFDNDTLTKWFSLTLNTSDTPIAIGQVRIVAGSFGGDAATPLIATATWPLVAKPTINVPATLMTFDAEGNLVPEAEAEAEPDTTEPDTASVAAF